MLNRQHNCSARSRRGSLRLEHKSLCFVRSQGNSKDSRRGNDLLAENGIDRRNDLVQITVTEKSSTASYHRCESLDETLLLRFRDTGAPFVVEVIRGHFAGVRGVEGLYGPV